MGQFDGRSQWHIWPSSRACHHRFTVRLAMAQNLVPMEPQKLGVYILSSENSNQGWHSLDQDVAVNVHFSWSPVAGRIHVCLMTKHHQHIPRAPACSGGKNLSTSLRQLYCHFAAGARVLVWCVVIIREVLVGCRFFFQTRCHGAGGVDFF